MAPTARSNSSASATASICFTAMATTARAPPSNCHPTSVKKNHSRDKKRSTLQVGSGLKLRPAGCLWLGAIASVLWQCHPAAELLGGRRASPQGLPTSLTSLLETEIEASAVHEIVLIAVSVRISQTSDEQRLEPRHVVVQFNRSERNAFSDI